MQNNMKDCGVAALLTIIRTNGGDVPYEYLRMLTKTSTSGTNAYYLLEAAKTLGFDTRALKGNVEDLNKSYLPCIAHVIIDSKYKHFVVIHEINNKYVTIADPSCGIRKLTINDFKKISTEQYLIFFLNKPLPNIKNDKKFIKLLISFFVTFKNVFTSIFIFSILYTLINVVLSYSFQFIIEDAINVNSVSNLYFIGVVVIFLTLISNVSNFIRNNMFNYVSSKIDFLLISDVFRQIFSLPYLYYKTRTTGDVLSRINDLDGIKKNLCNLIINFFVDGTLVIFVFFFLCRINLTLSLIALCIGIIYFLIIKLFSNSIYDMVLENKKNSSLLNSNLVEYISSIQTIKGMNAIDNYKNKLCDTYKNHLNKNYEFTKIFNIEEFIKEIVNSLGLCLILLIGGYLVLKGKMRLEALITYNALIIYFLEPIKNVVGFDFALKEIRASIKRIIDLYSIKTCDTVLEPKYTSSNIYGDISVRNLSYSYNKKDKILKNITFDVDRGEKIVISGYSGSGKSTLSKIICGYLEIDNDMIYIDGIDINSHNIIKLTRDVCYISQKEVMFTDSIYNNIVMERDISYEKFLEVCKITGVDTMVKSKLHSYNFLLEEGGFNISGGERQRIILARALLKDASIYIFDESFSEMDVDSEGKILSKIFGYLADKTILVISHRDNNNLLFDKCFTIKNGKIYNGYYKI